MDNVSNVLGPCVDSRRSSGTDTRLQRKNVREEEKTERKKKAKGNFHPLMSNMDEVRACIYVSCIYVSCILQDERIHRVNRYPI